MVGLNEGIGFDEIVGFDEVIGFNVVFWRKGVNVVFVTFFPGVKGQLALKHIHLFLGGAKGACWSCIDFGKNPLERVFESDFEEDKMEEELNLEYGSVLLKIYEISLICILFFLF